MRMQDKANGDSEEKSVGEISDQHEQDSQVERKAVQTRTFTRWMNVFLQRRDPPVAVHDLFTDIRDGGILMALLEELSGCKLLYRFRSSPHRIFRLNNISKALAFLDDRHVKLLGIDPSGIADGIPSVVLNLVWNIILYFQVKQVTGGLQRCLSSSLSSLSMSSYPSSSELSLMSNDIGSYSCSTLPSKGRKTAKEPKYHGKAIKTLLQWVQRCTSKFGVEVRDFGKSWRSGLAFLAMIKSINPALVDLRDSLSREPGENIQLAFMMAHRSLDIPPLLEPEDVSCASPDEQSIITYVSMFLGHCAGVDEDHTAHSEVPEIPHFGSLESVSFGETLADDPEAQALLRGLEKSSEQLLWTKWSTRATPLHTRAAATSDPSWFRSQSISEQPVGASPYYKKTSRSRGVSKPPSPLDAGIVNQEIRLWMEKASVGQGCNKPRAGEGKFSLSSEEGTYSLSALDSDEEEAYSYILDLNKDVFQPHNQLKRQEPRLVEETLLNGQQSKEIKPRRSRVLNGSGVRADRSRTNESSSRETANNRAAFDTEPEEENRSREARGEERDVKGKSNDDYSEEERKEAAAVKAGVTMRGYEKTETPVDKTERAKSSEVESLRKEPETKSNEKRGQGKKGNLRRFEEGRRRERGEERREEEDEEEDERRKSASEASCEVRAARVNAGEETDGKVKEMSDEEGYSHVKNSMNSEAKTTGKEATVDHHGSWTLPCSASSQPRSRDGGFALKPSAAPCDATPLELEALLVLWILLYCVFMLPQTNL